MTDDERIIATLTQLLPPDMAEMCSQRIRQGAKTYGTLDLATDTRDFAQEAREELADAAYYLVCAQLLYAVRHGGQPNTSHATGFWHLVGAWTKLR